MSRRWTWESWFAWHPVRVGDGWVWLQAIERRGKMTKYEYRMKWNGGVA